MIITGQNTPQVYDTSDFNQKVYLEMLTPKNVKLL